ncbi:MAG: hypothetical protein GC162_04785 [Planctomycetes bacterium]|nr:hypothetical protein [Planctomycetota bacterium]
MPTTGTSHEIVVWMDAARAPLVEAVLGRLADLRVLAIGGPRRSGIAPLAESLGVRADDDLRKMLIDQPAGYMLLAVAGGISRAELAQARSAGTMILALEPIASAIDALPHDESQAGHVVSLPWFRAAAAWQHAADPQQVLGAIRSVRISALASAHAGSLYARLYDAMEMLMSLLPAPDTVDAALTGPLKQIPEDPRNLTGHLTAHLRIGAAASAIIHASDNAAVWRRNMVVLGDEGQLVIDDEGYRLYSAAGELLDEHPAPAAAPDPAELIVRQFRRMLDGAPLPRPVEPRQVIAACQAALLSCRTGQMESVSTLLRISGA